MKFDHHGVFIEYIVYYYYQKNEIAFLPKTLLLIVCMVLLRSLQLQIFQAHFYCLNVGINIIFHNNTSYHDRKVVLNVVTATPCC